MSIRSKLDIPLDSPTLFSRQGKMQSVTWNYLGLNSLFCSVHLVYRLIHSFQRRSADPSHIGTTNLFQVQILHPQKTQFSIFFFHNISNLIYFILCIYKFSLRSNLPHVVSKDHTSTEVPKSSSIQSSALPL